MANLTFWKKDGKLVVDANKKPIKCARCPCSTFGCDSFKGTSITLEVWDVGCVDSSGGDCIRWDWAFMMERYTGTYASCEKLSNGQFRVSYTVAGSGTCVSLTYSATGTFVSGYDSCKMFEIIPGASPPPGGMVSRLMTAPVI